MQQPSDDTANATAATTACRTAGSAPGSSPAHGAGANGPTCAARLDIVRKRDVGPLDMLVGRGHFKSPGNARYLRIVSQRQADYRSARHADKERIAREVLEVICRPGGGEDDGGGGGGGEDGANSNDDANADDNSDDNSHGHRRARFLQLEPDEDHRQPDSLCGWPPV